VGKGAKQAGKGAVHWRGTGIKQQASGGQIVKMGFVQGMGVKTKEPRGKEKQEKDGRRGREGTPSKLMSSSKMDFRSGPTVDGRKTGSGNNVTCDRAGGPTQTPQGKRDVITVMNRPRMVGEQPANNNLGTKGVVRANQKKSPSS